MAQLVPIDARNVFQEIPGVAVVSHPLSHTRLPILWDKELSGPSVLRNHQKQALVAFAPSAPAVGLAALAFANQQRSADHGALAEYLCQLRSSPSFGRGHLGVGNAALYVCHICIMADTGACQAHKRMRICPMSPTRPQPFVRTGSYNRERNLLAESLCAWE